jgi:hypothetical protein
MSVLLPHPASVSSFNCGLFSGIWHLELFKATLKVFEKNVFDAPTALKTLS